jgi:hypothetical protein
MLTGEAVPETKTAIPRSNLDEVFNAREHQRHTLFRGTRVIQVNFLIGNIKRRLIVIKSVYIINK